MTSLADIQARTWAAKLAHGFDTTDVPADIGRLRGEVDEFEQAHTAGDLDGAALELADIVIYTAGLAQILGIDLGDAVDRKLDIISKRVYVRDETGKLVKVEP